MDIRGDYQVLQEAAAACRAVGVQQAMQGLLTQHNFAQLASYLTRAAKRRFGVGHAENMQRVVAGMAGVEHDDGSSSSDTDNAIIDMVAVEDQSD